MSKKKAERADQGEPLTREANGSPDENDRRALLRQEITRTQDDLEAALTDLRDVVEESMERVDVRRRIATRPLPWLAGGFTVGLLLGLRGRA